MNLAAKFISGGPALLLLNRQSIGSEKNPVLIDDKYNDRARRREGPAESLSLLRTA